MQLADVDVVEVPLRQQAKWIYLSAFEFSFEKCLACCIREPSDAGRGPEPEGMCSAMSSIGFESWGGGKPAARRPPWTPARHRGSRPKTPPHGCAPLAAAIDTTHISSSTAPCQKIAATWMRPTRCGTRRNTHVSQPAKFACPALVSTHPSARSFLPGLLLCALPLCCGSASASCGMLTRSCWQAPTCCSRTIRRRQIPDLCKPENCAPETSCRRA